MKWWYQNFLKEKYVDFDHFLTDVCPLNYPALLWRAVKIHLTIVKHVVKKLSTQIIKGFVISELWFILKCPSLMLECLLQGWVNGNPSKKSLWYILKCIIYVLFKFVHWIFLKYFSPNYPLNPPTLHYFQCSWKKTSQRSTFSYGALLVYT